MFSFFGSRFCRYIFIRIPTLGDNNAVFGFYSYFALGCGDVGYEFAAELFQLASGVPFGELANPELFPAGPPANVTPEFAAMVLKGADELLFTLRFNVNEELALRAFAVGTAMKS